MNGNSPYITVEEALVLMKAGRPLIVTDDEGRENEGDLIFAAEKCGMSEVNLMITRGRGLVCQAITSQHAARLNLDYQAPVNDSLMGTAFTVSVDVLEGTTTGISAADRAATIRAIVDSSTRPEDLGRPGHMFPLIADDGGVRTRPGHTEAAVELARLSGFKPSGVICEILNSQGIAAVGDELAVLASELDTGILTIAQLISWLEENEPVSAAHAAAPAAPDGSAGESFPTPTAVTRLPTPYGEFSVRVYPNPENPDMPHSALVSSVEPRDGIPAVRIHSECLSGEVWHSLRCDCRAQLEAAMKHIGQNGGALIYLRQEGRGIGLEAKMQAYTLQDQGLDTFEANTALGFGEDERRYDIAHGILGDLGYSKLRLITNNPDKMSSVRDAGFDVIESIELETPVDQHNRRYLETKHIKGGHSIPALRRTV